MGDVTNIIQLIQNPSKSKAISLARLSAKTGRKRVKEKIDSLKGEGNLSGEEIKLDPLFCDFLIDSPETKGL